MPKKSLPVKYLALLAIVLVGLFPPTVVRDVTSVSTSFRYIGAPTTKVVVDPYINWPILFWIGFAIVFAVYVFRDQNPS